MPGDVLDQGWVYKHAKGRVLIPSHLANTSYRLLLPSSLPKMVEQLKYPLSFLPTAFTIPAHPSGITMFFSTNAGKTLCWFARPTWRRYNFPSPEKKTSSPPFERGQWVSPARLRVTKTVAELTFGRDGTHKVEIGSTP